MGLGFLYESPFFREPFPFSLPTFLALELLVVTGLTAFRLAVLGYSVAEAASLLPLDAAVAAVLLLATLGNPLKAPLVYGVAYILFVVAFLRQEPPSGFWRWFGTFVVLGLLWGVFALLWRISPLVTGALLLSYILVRVLLPLHYRNEAREVLAKGKPFPVGQRFVATLADHGSFSLAREKFRWFLDDGARSGEGTRAVRAAHRQVRARMKELGVYHVAWDRLHARTERLQDGRELYLYEGRTVGLLRRKEDLPAGGRLENPAAAEESQLPALLLDVGPIAVRLVASPGGGYRVDLPPPEIPLRLVP
ncbi:MAG TPA: hypothetical protein PLL76_10980 [Thermoanaerobaculia bacterium]|nr:hypothetical protein [Thermoanaerobaculia bacterium]